MNSAQIVNVVDIRKARRRIRSVAHGICRPPIGFPRATRENVGMFLGARRGTGYRGNRMSAAAFGEDSRMRMEALRRQIRLLPREVRPQIVGGVAIRQLRGATEYRGRRDQLLASSLVRPEWLPPERIAGQRTRATLRARYGGRDVFARRLDDGKICVLVIYTALERATQDRFAFERFLRVAMTQRPEPD